MGIAVKDSSCWNISVRGGCRNRALLVALSHLDENAWEIS
jgi:hypothetical protein